MKNISTDKIITKKKVNKGFWFCRLSARTGWFLMVATVDYWAPEMWLVQTVWCKCTMFTGYQDLATPHKL